MLTVGLASGLGNCVYMLPAVKALALAGHDVELYVQTDFPTAALWRRCVYASRVLEPPAELNGRRLVAGEYAPQAWRDRQVLQQKLTGIHDCVWQSNMLLARRLGYGGEVPDVSDWCRSVDRTPRWDVGVVPGCKGGYWMRKRWPGLGTVASHFLSRRLRVAVFGLAGDGVETVPGEYIDTGRIETLPDVLAACRVVIGGDCGPVHLASSLGVPVVVVYTATSERKADPVGRTRAKVASPAACHPCVSTSRWHACRDWRCREIDPGKVLAAAEGLLGAGGAER